MELKDQIGLIFGEGQTVKREKKRRRRRRRGEVQAKLQNGMETELKYGNYFEYGFCMDHVEFKA